MPITKCYLSLALCNRKAIIIAIQSIGKYFKENSQCSPLDSVLHKKECKLMASIMWLNYTKQQK